MSVGLKQFSTTGGTEDVEDVDSVVGEDELVEKSGRAAHMGV